MARYIWLSIGWVALGLGAIGVVMPVLPTTPFVLLAAFAFGKGSPVMRQWLLDHRIFGDAIRDWEKTGAIAPKYKAMACGLMGLTFLASLWFALPVKVLIIQAICMGGASLYVLSRPSS
jgi:uncharacterized membrane protein YbaN (DUF454 family)